MSHTIIAQGPLWKNPGDYTWSKLAYGENNIAETMFGLYSRI